MAFQQFDYIQWPGEAASNLTSDLTSSQQLDLRRSNSQNTQIPKDDNRFKFPCCPMLTTNSGAKKMRPCPARAMDSCRPQCSHPTRSSDSYRKP